jgi:hypothetical protein
LNEPLKILVAEDDFQVQEMLEDALNEGGFLAEILSSVTGSCRVSCVVRNHRHGFGSPKTARQPRAGLKGFPWQATAVVAHRNRPEYTELMFRTIPSVGGERWNFFARHGPIPRNQS